MKYWTGRPKINLFTLSIKEYILDQIIQKKCYVILKTEALLATLPLDTERILAPLKEVSREVLVSASVFKFN